jgi:hypothetical protein
VRIEKILCTVRHEAHRRQVEETIDTPAEGPGGFYVSYLDYASFRPPTEWKL